MVIAAGSFGSTSLSRLSGSEVLGPTSMARPSRTICWRKVSSSTPVAPAKSTLVAGAARPFWLLAYSWLALASHCSRNQPPPPSMLWSSARPYFTTPLWTSFSLADRSSSRVRGGLSGSRPAFTKAARL
jgi:hypothetical protein